MEKRTIFAAILAVCLLLSACAGRDTPPLSSPGDSGSSAPSSQTEGPPEPSEDEAPAPYQELRVPFLWGGNGDEQKRFLSISCPADWVADGTINLNGKKIVEALCFTPDRMEEGSQMSRLDSAEQKEIGGQTFWVLSEEQYILEKPNWTSYLIWQYYCFDGELYYRIAFFQDQENLPVTLDEFEDVLTTMKILKE